MKNIKANNYESGGILNNFIIFVISFSVILLPIFFLPFLSNNFLLPSKSIFFIFSVNIAIILYLLNILILGRLSLVRHSFFNLTLCLPMFFMIPLLFADSFLGGVYRYDSFLFLFYLLYSVILFSLFFQNHKRQLNFYLSFLFISSSAAIYQLFRFFIGALWPNLGIWNYLPSSLLGGWLESGIFFGLNIILLLIFSQSSFFKNSIPLFKKIILLFLFLFLSNLILINFKIVWILLLILGLFILLFNLKNNNIDYFSLVVIFPATIFVVFAGWFSDIIFKLYDWASFSFSDVRPGLSYTLETYSNIWSDSFWSGLFGLGLNNFYYAWNNFRPAEVLLLDNFWSFAFNGGNSIILSFFITAGLLGGLALLLWLSSIFYYVLRNFNIFLNEKYLNLHTMWAGAVIYLLFFNIFYFYPGILWILFFVFIGFLISAIFNKSEVIVFNLSSNRRLRIIGTLIISLIIGILLINSIVLTRQIFAWYRYEAGQRAFRAQDYDSADKYFNKAASLGHQAKYYRALVDNSLAALDKNLSEFSLEQQGRYESIIQSNIKQAMFYGQKAIDINSSNYLYHIYLGRVHEILIFLIGDIESDISRQSYDLAQGNYKTALDLATTRPEIYLELARLEIAIDNWDMASEYLNKAIDMKKNYYQAYIWLVQVAERRNDFVEAEKAIAKILDINPYNPDSYFWAGYLKYQQKDYGEAIKFLETAIDLSPSFTSAYFLGLSYDGLGRRTEALDLFEDLLTENQYSEKLVEIVNNLRAGRRALAEEEEISMNLFEE